MKTICIPISFVPGMTQKPVRTKMWEAVAERPQALRLSIWTG
jgi:hypothetical protein